MKIHPVKKKRKKKKRTGKWSSLSTMDARLIKEGHLFFPRALDGNSSIQEQPFNAMTDRGNVEGYHVAPGKLLEIRNATNFLAIFQDKVGTKSRSKEKRYFSQVTVNLLKNPSYARYFKGNLANLHYNYTIP